MATPTLDEADESVRAFRREHAQEPDEYVVAFDMVRTLDALSALVAHVRALENVTRMTDDKALERITALEAKVAALSAADDVGRAAARAESATSPRMAQKAWAPVAEEMDRLRVENAELRKRVEALTGVPAPEQQWPAPQPIETAPLAEILTYPLGNPERKGWAREWPGTGETVDEWRAILKKWGRTHWLPMPPPPGGAK